MDPLSSYLSALYIRTGYITLRDFFYPKILFTSSSAYIELLHIGCFYKYISNSIRCVQLLTRSPAYRSINTSFLFIIFIVYEFYFLIESFVKSRTKRIRISAQPRRCDKLSSVAPHRHIFFYFFFYLLTDQQAVHYA